MKKDLVAAALLVAMVGPASAWDHRRHNPRGAQQQHHHRHQHHNHRINPWVAGAIGLGVVGAGTYYYNQRRSCWEEPMVDQYGRQFYDRYGRPVFQQVCQ